MISMKHPFQMTLHPQLHPLQRSCTVLHFED